MRPIEYRRSVLGSCVAAALALGAALLAETATSRPAEAMQMASGSYVGDGTARRPVTGVGFRPDALIIKGDAAQLAVMRTATMAGDAAKELAAATGLRSKRISSLDADGFTVGAHAEVNRPGVAYFWTAFKDDGGGDFRVGSYVGTGRDNLSVGGLGFPPSYVIVMPDRNERAVQRSSAMIGDYSLQFASTGPKSNYIQALQSDGFQVGTDARVNSRGTTYHYAAWKAVPGRMSVGSYTGNGEDDRSLSGVGFSPDYLIIKASVNETALHRSTLPTGDSTLTFSASANLANAIQRLEADGFQVGTANAVNGPKTTYYWMAFRAAAGPSPAPALAVTSVNGGYDPIAGTGFAVVIRALDADGTNRTVTAATGVRLSVKTGSGLLGGTFSGTIPAGTSEVTIAGVTYTKAESGVVLTATRTSGDDLTSGDSTPFTVDPAGIAGYMVSLSSPQPAGVTFEVTVTARDQFSNPVTTDSSTLVSLSSSSGRVSFDGNRDGIFDDNVKRLEAGSVSLNARDTTAETTALTATDTAGKTGSVSLTINAGAASALAFTTQPENATAGRPIPGPPTVAVQDGFGNAVTSSTVSITVAIGANPGSGTLAGTTTKAATAGVARFDDLAINNPGNGYTLAASAPGLAGVTSAGFTVTVVTGALSGTVTSASDGHPLGGALVAALQAGLVKGSVTTGADGTYSMGAVAPGSYDVRASAVGYQSQTRAGITVAGGTLTTVDLSLVATPTPSIRITSPAAGTVINGPSVSVRGDVIAPTGTQVGVTVNGVPGIVGNGQFAALVPVDPGVAGLTANLNSLSGALASDTIEVSATAQPAEAPVLLLASPSGGPAPLTAVFTLSSLIGVSQVAFDADGDGIVDFQGSTLEGREATYSRPGVYTPTVQVTDAQGQVHTAATLIHVFDPGTLDSQLQAVWQGFKDAVRAGDIAGAGAFLHSDTRAVYQDQLAQLSPAALAAIDQIMTPITPMQVGFGGAQYEMVRDGLSFAVWFQIDHDGLWRLRRF